MFERFTTTARRTVVLAQEEARRLNHNYIGTEHILLGLLGEPEDVAATVLAGFGVTRDSARREVTAIVGTGSSNPVGHIPFTPRAKKCLEVSLREALALRHRYIGTEHILLGLIREGDGVAAQVLRAHGDLLAIRAAVLDAVPAGEGDGGDEPAGPWAPWLRRILGGPESGGRGRAVRTRPFQPAEEAAPPVTPAGEAALSEAARLAGPNPIGSQHLLLAALADTESAAARVLLTLGVDLDQARSALRSASVTGTSDESPEEAGRRQMAIAVTGEALTLTVTDPVLVTAGQAALAALAAGGTEGGEAAGGTEGGEAAGGPSAGPESGEAAGGPSAGPESGEAAGGPSAGPESGEAAGGPSAGPESGEATGGSAAATVIRGDHPAAAGLASVWLELRACLEQVRNSATPPAAA